MYERVHRVISMVGQPFGELDAAFFHLYGVVRDDVDYIMETFPIVRKSDEKAFGDYRTKINILRVYDRIAKAQTDGSRYQTVLDPPPAHESLAHDGRRSKAR